MTEVTELGASFDAATEHCARCGSYRLDAYESCGRENFDGTRPFGDTWSTFNGLSDHVPVIGSCVASS